MLTNALYLYTCMLGRQPFPFYRVSHAAVLSASLTMRWQADRKSKDIFEREGVKVGFEIPLFGHFKWGTWENPAGAMSKTSGHFDPFWLQTPLNCLSPIIFSCTHILYLWDFRFFLIFWSTSGLRSLLTVGHNAAALELNRGLVCCMFTTPWTSFWLPRYAVIAVIFLGIFRSQLTSHEGNVSM